MTAAHTPGPWRYRLHGPELPHYDIGPAGKDGRIPMTECVATTVTGYDPEGIRIAEANARLIAAAPDLLAAIEAFLDTWYSEEPFPVKGSALLLDLQSSVDKAKGVDP